jgi:hypothetical protein
MTAPTDRRKIYNELDASKAMPIDPEARERWQRDPAAYSAVERLHESGEALIAAVDEQLNAIALLFTLMHEPARSLYRDKGTTVPVLNEATAQVEQAQARWVAAVSDAEALLRDRQEGGE